MFNLEHIWTIKKLLKQRALRPKRNAGLNETDTALVSYKLLTI